MFQWCIMHRESQIRLECNKEVNPKSTSFVHSSSAGMSNWRPMGRMWPKLLLKCGPQLSFKPSNCLKLNVLMRKGFQAETKLRILPNCGPLTNFQSFNAIERSAHGFELDMPDLVVLFCKTLTVCSKFHLMAKQMRQKDAFRNIWFPSSMHRHLKHSLFIL